MKIVYVVIVLLVAIIAVMFAAQNSAQIAISFFAWSASGSLSLILIITLSIGIAIGILIMAPSVFRRSIQSSGLKRKLNRSEKEKASMSEKIAASQTPPSAEPEATTQSRTDKKSGN
jgi:lipopolysaccharide assembly protein A